MKTINHTITVLNKNIEISATDTGRGVNVLIAGGESAHIGAISIARPGAETITEVFPTHKDGVISKKWADAICAKVNESVVVSCGIHYDNINIEQINQIVSATDCALSQVLDRL